VQGARLFVQDTSFNWEDFAARINNELLCNFGNFVQRALSFCVARFNSELPALGKLTDADWTAIAEFDAELQTYHRQMDNVHLRDACVTILNMSRIGNQFFQVNEPWALVKSGAADADKWV
jgi:methionyl-tRNA synthetase